MAKKSKKKAEPKAAEGTPAARHEPDEPELQAVSKTGIGSEMDIRAGEAVSPASDEAQMEAIAEAADTFEQAYEDRLPADRPDLPAFDLIEASESGSEAVAQPGANEEEGKAEAAEFTAAKRPAVRLERLQKILSQAGVASRRHAEELIVEGRVQVNGQVVTALGSKADPDHDHIRVDGKLLRGAERLRYFMLNKPKGYVTTVSDPEGRPTVMQFFKKMNERLYPVGRLDYQSEGLLLVTNDGDLANRLTRPASGVQRTYLVKVSGRPAPDELEKLRLGLAIDRGRPGEGRVQTSPAAIRQAREGENPWFEVVLTEGRNRELRKMFEEIGHHVEKIRRVGYGPLVLDVEPGRFRELEPEEVARLRQAAEGKWRPAKPKQAGRRRKEFGGQRPESRRPEEQRGTGKRKPSTGGKEWKREDRGGWRGRAASAEGGRPSRRNAPAGRAQRPWPGGGKPRGPEKSFGERGRWQQEPREDRPRTGGTGPRQQRADGQRSDFRRGARFDAARSEPQGPRGGKSRPAGARPAARGAAGAQFGKFRPGGGQGRPAAGPGAKASSPRSWNRRPSPSRGGNRPQRARGKQR